MGRVYEYLSRGLDPDLEHMDEDFLLSSMDQEEQTTLLSDEGQQEFVFDYEKEAKKDHNV